MPAILAYLRAANVQRPLKVLVRSEHLAARDNTDMGSAAAVVEIVVRLHRDSAHIFTTTTTYSKK